MQCCVWFWSWGIPSDPKPTRKWTAHHRVYMVVWSMYLFQWYTSPLLCSTKGACVALNAKWTSSDQHCHRNMAPSSLLCGSTLFLAQNIFWHEIQQGFTFDNISTLSADNWQGGGWIWLFALFSTILLDLKMWAWLPIGFCIVRLPLPPPLLQKQISTQRHLINSCASHNWTQILILGYLNSKVEQNIFDRRKDNLVISQIYCIYVYTSKRQKII